MHLVASTPNAHRCWVQSYPGIAGLGGTSVAAASAAVAATVPVVTAPAAAAAALHARALPRQLRNSRRPLCWPSSFSLSSICSSICMRSWAIFRSAKSYLKVLFTCCAGVIGRHVFGIRVAQALHDSRHHAIVAGAALVGLEGVDQIIPGLPGKVWPSSVAGASVGAVTSSTLRCDC